MKTVRMAAILFAVGVATANTAHASQFLKVVLGQATFGSCDLVKDQFSAMKMAVAVAQEQCQGKVITQQSARTTVVMPTGCDRSIVASIFSCAK